MRQLTYCHLVMEDAGFELEFDGEEIWHVDPADYRVRQRLPEFAADWTLASDLPSQAHHSIGTCFYNIPRCIAGENDPPESIVPLTSLLYTKRDVEIGVQNTLICFVTDFHPPPVNISWTRNGEPVNELDVTETQYYSNPNDFSFRIFSYLDFYPEQGDIYTCTVRHRGQEREITRFLEVKQEDPREVETAVLVAGIVVGFLGLVAGIFVIVMSKMELPAV